MLRVTFLGTASSRPTVGRNVSALTVHREGDFFLFDCGEGTQRQMMRYGVGFGIQEIFITHPHADHYLGLPGLLQTMNLQGREDPLVIWGPPGARAVLQAAVDLGGNRLRFSVSVRELPPSESVRYEGYRLEAFRTRHKGPSMGVALVEDPRLGRFDPERAEEMGVPEGPLFGRLHRGEPVETPEGRVVEPEQVVGPPRPGRKLVYTGDTAPCDATREAAAEADLLVHEATFGEAEAERAAETGHSTARQAAAVAADAGVRELLLTHFSARYSELADRLEEQAAAVFPGARAAEDGMTVVVPYRDQDAEMEFELAGRGRGRT